MNVPKIITTVSTELANTATKAISKPIKPTPIIDGLNGLDALSSYNLGNIKKLIKYGNVQIQPISSEKEFDLVMNSLNRTKDNAFIFGQCFAAPNALDKHLKALQAYCGEHDISTYINRYLATGEVLPEMKVGNLATGEIHSLKEEDLKEYIRILEYSLRKVDEDIQPFNGTVYRSGYFSKDGGQFWSTSKNMKGAVVHASGTEEFPVTFSVIKSTKGTDIQEVNKNTRFANEAEVLIHPNTQFMDITDETSQEEYASYYNEILDTVLSILKRNLGIEDKEKAKEFIGSLRIYQQK